MRQAVRIQHLLDFFILFYYFQWLKGRALTVSALVFVIVSFLSYLIKSSHLPKVLFSIAK